MRLIFLPVCALAVVAAAPDTVPAGTPDAMLPGYTEPAQRWTSLEEAMADRRCEDRIEQVRDAAGQPEIDRDPASAEKPMMIAAVDKRIERRTVRAGTEGAA